MNNSRVIPARLRATKIPTGSAVEVLLIEEVNLNDWWVMLRPGKRVRAGTVLAFPHEIHANVLEKNEDGQYRLNFTGTENILESAEQFGEVPLPPYISREAAPDERDRERYQTVFAGPKGSVAAPTAGLHFTPAMLERLRTDGIQTAWVTLHVGAGTFAPVKSELVAEHRMHYERFEITTETAARIAETKERGGRVIAVGTTSLRVLESAALLANTSTFGARSGRTNLFVYPPHSFRVVDALLTNFHLPESTLLMLVSAFVSPGRVDGREWMLQVYQEAIRERYRFFSYGDAMLIL